MLVADLDLIARWADAWAISRGAAMPVARDGGLYIHVDQPDQVGRYLFARLDADAIRPLATSIDRPLLYLKVCASADMVRPLLPPGWEIATPGYMMTAPLSVMLDRPAAVPTEFEIRITCEHSITFAHIDDASGEEAACGRIVAVDGLIVFDRIRTAEHYQRRGLAARSCARWRRKRGNRASKTRCFARRRPAASSTRRWDGRCTATTPRPRCRRAFSRRAGSASRSPAIWRRHPVVEAMLPLGPGLRRGGV